MRALGMIVAATLLTVGSARADRPPPPPDPDRDAAIETARLFMMGLEASEAGALVAMMDATVRHDLATDRCGRGFRRPGKVVKAQRKKLAACLIKLGWSAPLALDATRDGKAVVVSSVGFGAAELRLRFQIAGDEARLVSVVHLPPPDVGEDEGAVAGIIEGVSGGGPSPFPVLPPPPPPPPTPIVPAATLESLRLAGERVIVPDAATQDAMVASGRAEVVTVFKVCLAPAGNLKSVTILRSSGFPDWDRLIQQRVWASWRWKPYVVQGRGVAVCSAVTLRYAIP